jgi:hypothetical protein
MPKFYHGEMFGFEYRTRAVGWRRVPLLSLFPYLTGDVIWIDLCLKPMIADQQWQTGVIQIEPPDCTFAKSSGHATLDAEQMAIARSSDHVFSFVEPNEWPAGESTAPKHRFCMGKEWSRTLPLKGGGGFGQPCDVGCFLIFQNIDGDKVEQTSQIPLARIEVVSRGPFITNLALWSITTLIAIAALVTKFWK